MQRIEVIANSKQNVKLSSKSMSGTCHIPGCQGFKVPDLIICRVKSAFTSRSAIHNWLLQVVRSLLRFFLYCPHANKAQLLQTRKHHTRRESPRPRVRVLNRLMNELRLFLKRMSSRWFRDSMRCRRPGLPKRDPQTSWELQPSWGSRIWKNHLETTENNGKTPESMVPKLAHLTCFGAA